MFFASDEAQLVVCLLDHERVVGRAHDRRAGVSGEACEQEGDGERVRAVEPRGGLVGEQQLRPGGDRPGDRDPGALAV